jgi:hypothetical protein
MLRSRCPFIRTSLFRPVRNQTNRHASSLRFAISPSKISPTPVLTVLLCRALGGAVFPTVHPIPRRHRRARSSSMRIAPSLPRIMPRMLGCYRHRRSPPKGRDRRRCRGRRDARLQQGDVTMKAHIANVCFKYFRRFSGTLLLFHTHVAKVD